MKSVALRDKQPTRDEIEKELEILETRQRELEMEGVVMEKKMRNTMAGEPEEAYLLTWFELVNQKNQLLRRENELIYMWVVFILHSLFRAQFGETIEYPQIGHPWNGALEFLFLNNSKSCSGACCNF